MANQNDKLYEKWTDWFKTLDTEILNLHSQRSMFDDVRNIIRSNSEIKTNHFPRNMSWWYVSYMCITVRKLIDESSSSVSYSMLLKNIKSNPQVISRTRFIAPWIDKEEAHNIFDIYARGGNEFLDLSIINAEITELEQKTEKIKKYVNKRIAHHDKKKNQLIPKF